MKATIDQSKLEEIHEATLLNGVALGDQDLIDIVGETADLESYRKAYDEFVKGPKELPADPKPAAARPATKQAQQKPAAKAPQQAAAPKRVVLRNADGTTSDLELVKETSSAIFVKVPEPKPKDEVTIMLSGTPYVVDINELLGLSPDDVRLGRKVSALLALAAAAK